MNINQLWSVMKHNIAILRIRLEMSGCLEEDYSNIKEYVHGTGDEIIVEAIEYYESHPELEIKMKECLDRYEKEFKALNADPMDTAKAINLLDFIKNFPKYITYDLHEN